MMQFVFFSKSLRLFQILFEFIEISLVPIHYSLEIFCTNENKMIIHDIGKTQFHDTLIKSL